MRELFDPSLGNKGSYIVNGGGQYLTRLLFLFLIALLLSRQLAVQFRPWHLDKLGHEGLQSTGMGSLERFAPGCIQST
jgi:hypothetical protein